MICSYGESSSQPAGVESLSVSSDPRSSSATMRAEEEEDEEDAAATTAAAAAAVADAAESDRPDLVEEVRGGKERREADEGADALESITIGVPSLVIMVVRSVVRMQD